MSFEVCRLLYRLKKQRKRILFKQQTRTVPQAWLGHVSPIFLSSLSLTPDILPQIDDLTCTPQIQFNRVWHARTISCLRYRQLEQGVGKGWSGRVEASRRLTPYD